MNSEEIIERLLRKKQITTKEAIVLLKDIEINKNKQELNIGTTSPFVVSSTPYVETDISSAFNWDKLSYENAVTSSKIEAKNYNLHDLIAGTDN